MEDKYTGGTIYSSKGKNRMRVRYKDGDGKWHSKTKPLQAKGKRAAKKELDAWMAELNEQAAKRAGAPMAGETTAEYLEKYIEGKALTIEQSTLASYRRTLKVHVRPYPIGDIPLDDLNPDIVREWVRQLAEKYEPVTVKRSFTLFKSAMTQATESDRLGKNPCRTVKPPKVPRKNPNALQGAGLARLMAMLDVPDLPPMLTGVKIALYTGMREGEICGLRWRYVDTRNRTITVAESIGRKDHSAYYVKEPKTGGSRRIVDMPEGLAVSMAARRAAMMRECLAAGVPFSEDMYVLGSIDGSFMAPLDLGKKWRELAKALDLVGTEGKRPTFHDLRHTYATLAITEGIDVKTVTSSMGHANAAMTLNTYASADPDAKRRAAGIMDDVFTELAERGKRGCRIVELDQTGTEG